MTAQARPTPGPWTLWGKPSPSQVIQAGGSFVAQTVGGNDEANAALIAEAGTVLHETGRTPRQLAEERAELVAALRASDEWIREALSLHVCNLPAANTLRKNSAAIAKTKEYRT